ncbi:MAG: hypothetical protein A3J62_03865 [Candidatus Buchananbacteria bacterium RIFCSPHIGHO2_02_FULL_38_8]|uniref:Chloroplast import component protein (Tic20) n=2 Tax=Candidatus Buchananiibacteriota TaxID=1817903 RepID=A0A1G1Y076_9BACT|nr:MAG: hypothetical protein A2731_01870 [Candidatus Buchananbacteria bacterium RIFCSPHIGHO2_01_FULL_39_8]OGY47832.1 MAG: hypothetical protein A3J62_03865 [Candidatus Buchananbacteria bacterium RIFCSPHIGHO2_02_FULL_38_8]
MVESKKPSSEEKVWAAVGYLWILSLVALAARKNNEYVRFHASQGALLFVFSVLFLLTGPFVVFLNFIVGVVAIVGIYKAWMGEKWELPVIGAWAKKLGDWVVKTLKL